MRLRVIISVVLTGLAFCVVSAGFSKGSVKNIFDYYLNLPSEYFYCEIPVKVTKEFREKQIVRKNISNGYLLAHSESYSMEIALFKKKNNGGDIVAVNISCGAGCMCNRFELLEPNDAGKFDEVTAELFPNDGTITESIKNLGDRSYSYILPEKGTTIKVVDSETKKYYLNIIWNGSAFKIR